MRRHRGGSGTPVQAKRFDGATIPRVVGSGRELHECVVLGVRELGLTERRRLDLPGPERNQHDQEGDRKEDGGAGEGGGDAVGEARRGTGLAVGRA